MTIAVAARHNTPIRHDNISHLSELDAYHGGITDTPPDGHYVTRREHWRHRLIEAALLSAAILLTPATYAIHCCWPLPHCYAMILVILPRREPLRMSFISHAIAVAVGCRLITRALPRRFTRRFHHELAYYVISGQYCC